jgi:hypothetical protein
LREIIAGEEPMIVVAQCGADQARTLVAPDLYVDFIRFQGGNRQIEQLELVLGRHARNVVEHLGQFPAARIARFFQAFGIGEFWPFGATTPNKFVEPHRGSRQAAYG